MDTVIIKPLSNLNESTEKQIYSAQLEAGKLWTFCVETHLKARQGHTKWPEQSALHKETKGQYSLFSQTVQQINRAFLGNIHATKKLRREQPQMKMKYPWRPKKFYPLIWPAQHLKYEDGVLCLPMGKGREPIRLEVDVEPGFSLVKIVWNYGYELHMTYAASAQDGQQSDVRATVDLGEIHTAAVTTNTGDGLIVSGRGIRSLKRLRHQVQGQFHKKIGRCVKYSRRWWKLTRAKWRRLGRIDRQIRDLRHKVWRIVVDWCAERNVSQIYVGDPHGVRNKNCGRKHNQRMAGWEYGKDKHYLTYKSALLGIEVTSGTERGTSSTCPVCGHKQKVKGRNWKCRACDFVGHRDLTGSANMHVIGFEEHIEFPTQITYRRPEKLGRRSTERHLSHVATTS